MGQRIGSVAHAQEEYLEPSGSNGLIFSAEMEDSRVVDQSADNFGRWAYGPVLTWLFIVTVGLVRPLLSTR